MNETFKRIKDKVLKLENIAANQISDKGFAFRTYKELSKFNHKKTHNPIFKKRQEI